MHFYETLDDGSALLADTLGAGTGRPDAWRIWCWRLYEKLQSHAYPERWLAENRCRLAGLRDGL